MSNYDTHMFENDGIVSLIFFDEILPLDNDLINNYNNSTHNINCKNSCINLLNQRIFEYNSIAHNINEKLKVKDVTSKNNISFIRAEHQLTRLYSKLFDIRINLLKFYSEIKILHNL